MKKNNSIIRNLYLVWGEAAGGKGIAIGIFLSTTLTLVAFKLSRMLFISKGFTEQISNALSLAIALIVILGTAFIVNFFFGTKRDIIDSEPSHEEIERLFSEQGIDAENEMIEIEQGPQDILIIAQESGILKQLKVISEKKQSTINEERNA